MRKALVLLPLLLAGCAGGVRQPATASFIPHSNIIMVTVSDPQPARAIELVAPSGAVIKATSVTTNHTGEPNAGLGLSSGGFGDGLGLGNGIGLALGSGIGFVFGGGWGPFDTPSCSPARPPGWGSGLTIAPPVSGGGAEPSGGSTSSATIFVDHPDEYRQHWRDYRIRVELGDAPDSRTVTLDAPAPPQPA